MSNTAIVAAHLALTIKHDARPDVSNPAVLVSTAACIVQLARAHQKCWAEHMSNPAAEGINTDEKARRILDEIRQTLRPFHLSAHDETDHRYATIILTTSMFGSRTETRLP
jgi:hypothetical protein